MLYLLQFHKRAHNGELLLLEEQYMSLKLAFVDTEQNIIISSNSLTDDSILDVTYSVRKHCSNNLLFY